ncbi:TPA: hypothetical protein NDU46_003225 [Pseudomonas aeruginosa]|nr:hypothetical protein [Pseudomonas aeruginosa]
MKSPERYYFSSDTLSSAEIQAGLYLAKSLLKNGTTIHIFLNTRKNADPLLLNVFSKLLINKLKAGESIKDGEFTIRLESTNTFKKFADYEVALVVHGSEKLIMDIDSANRCGHLIVMVNNIDSPTNWLSKEPKRLRSEEA